MKFAMPMTITGIALILGLSGCTQNTLLSERPWGYETREDLEIWAVEEIDSTIAASSLTEGWIDVDPDKPRSWDTDREGVVSHMRSNGCVVADHGARPTRMSLVLVHNEPEQPFEMLDRIRAHWESEGWSVNDIFPLDPDSAEPYEYFVANREDGAMKAVQATEHAIVLDVTTVCSDHSSVSY